MELNIVRYLHISMFLQGVFILLDMLASKHWSHLLTHAAMVIVFAFAVAAVKLYHARPRPVSAPE